MKRCGHCHEVKAYTEFHKDPWRPDGFSRLCRICKNEYQLARYSARRDHVLKQRRKRYNEQDRVTRRKRERAYKARRTAARRVWMDVVRQKECVRCRQLLPMKDFALCRANEDGVRDDCRECVRKLRQGIQPRVKSPKVFEDKVEWLRRTLR